MNYLRINVQQQQQTSIYMHKLCNHNLAIISSFINYYKQASDKANINRLTFTRLLTIAYYKVTFRNCDFFRNLTCSSFWLDRWPCSFIYNYTRTFALFSIFILVLHDLKFVNFKVTMHSLHLINLSSSRATYKRSDKRRENIKNETHVH